MVRGVLVCLCLALLGGAGWAQPGAVPPVGNGAGQPLGLVVPGRYLVLDAMAQPVLAYGAQGLFLLNRGVLAKFDAQTFAPRGQVALFGPRPEQPKAGFASWQESDAYLQECGRRLLPATMTLQGDTLLVCCGDQFIAVDPATLQVRVNTSFTAQDQLPARVRSLVYNGQAPVPAFTGTTAYQLSAIEWPQRVDELRAIHLQTGKAQQAPKLPEAVTAPLRIYPIDGEADFRNAYQLRQHSTLTVLATPAGVLLLHNGVLAKLDPQTLEPVAQVELFGPLPALQDPNAATAAEKHAYNLEVVKRSLPASVFTREDDLYIVTGNSYFSVNTVTMQVTAHVPLVSVAADKLATFLDELAGQPDQPVAFDGKYLALARDTQLVLTNTATDKVTATALPEVLTRRLPASAPLNQEAQLAAVPENGTVMGLNGLLEQHTGEQGVFWSIRSDHGQGEFVLTGDKLTALLNQPNIMNCAVTVSGTFQQQRDGVPTYGKGSILVNQATAFDTITVWDGTVTKRTRAEGDYWTIKNMAGTEFVLVGDKAAELAKDPGVAGHPVFLMGKLQQDYPGVPASGRGYLVVTQYTVRPTPREAEQANDDRRPLALALGPVGLYAARGGVVVQFNPATGAVLGQHDLFPPLPVVPEGGFANKSDAEQYNQARAQRATTAALFPTGARLLAVQSNQCAVLAAETLAPAGETISFTAPTQNVFAPASTIAQFVGTTLFIHTGASLRVIDGAAGTPRAEVPYPAELTAHLFPDPRARVQAAAK